MQSKKEDKMSREEIIHYVDDLIKANKKSYDKRLAPLLYEFFLRANEKFEWSRDDFLKKYKNFRNNVKIIKIEDLEEVEIMSSSLLGGFLYSSNNTNNKGIYINKDYIENVKKEPTDELIDLYIIDCLFHECLHATDLVIENGEIKQCGLDSDKSYGDTMLNEYANVLSSNLISSGKTMYTDKYGIDYRNNGSYSWLKCPGEIMCAALDITEPQLAKLKDKGGEFFYEYLQDKFPYVDIETTVKVFKLNLNLINNSSENNEKKFVSIGLKSMLDAANKLISLRLNNALMEGRDAKENLKRIYYDIFKIQQILQNVDRIYELEGDNEVCNFSQFSNYLELERKTMIYNRFLDNEKLFTEEEKESIHKRGKCERTNRK